MSEIGFAFNISRSARGGKLSKRLTVLGRRIELNNSTSKIFATDVCKGNLFRFCVGGWKTFPENFSSHMTQKSLWKLFETRLWLRFSVYALKKGFTDARVGIPQLFGHILQNTYSDKIEKGHWLVIAFKNNKKKLYYFQKRKSPGNKIACVMK